MMWVFDVVFLSIMVLPLSECNYYAIWKLNLAEGNLLSGERGLPMYRICLQTHKVASEGRQNATPNLFAWMCDEPSSIPPATSRFIAGKGVRSKSILRSVAR
jgi:hypothetical protein